MALGPVSPGPRRALMPDSLERFVQAQDPLIAQVRRELADGHKRTHWMWFVFPQLAGLGHSPMARHYALASLAEAKSYLTHPVLGPRLIELTDLVNQLDGASVHAIFGDPDALKFHSSITLFACAAPDLPVFRDALAKYFDGAADPLTTTLLSKP